MERSRRRQSFTTAAAMDSDASHAPPLPVCKRDLSPGDGEESAPAEVHRYLSSACDLKGNVYGGLDGSDLFDAGHGDSVSQNSDPSPSPASYSGATWPFLGGYRLWFHGVEATQRSRTPPSSTAMDSEGWRAPPLPVCKRDLSPGDGEESAPAEVHRYLSSACDLKGNVYGGLDGSDLFDAGHGDSVSQNSDPSPSPASYSGATWPFLGGYRLWFHGVEATQRSRTPPSSTAMDSEGWRAPPLPVCKRDLSPGDGEESAPAEVHRYLSSACDLKGQRLRRVGRQ
ncbi:hypothetical protein V5799_020472 [Amblyomma americanum]|uniref:Uncharacterized protein n=1 Tax=Amblyomma americanum TaxID=6943 RepID=A0AAQ4EU91_AMBAM